MMTSRMASAMGYLDDELVSGAIEFKRTKNKLAWLPYATAAACLCLVVCVTVKIIVNANINAKSNVPVYGVLAEVVGSSENGHYEVRITGGDKNFAEGDIVTIDSVNTASQIESLDEGDVIAITYSTFEKNETIYEIIPGQIDIVTPSSN